MRMTRSLPGRGQQIAQFANERLRRVALAQIRDRPGTAVVQSLTSAGFKCRPLPQALDARPRSAVPRVRFA